MAIIDGMRRRPSSYALRTLQLAGSILLPVLLWSQYTDPVLLKQQPPDTLDLAFQKLTINEGLSQGMVNTIIQDRYGFMWFGTKDGLNRYDGYSFKVFRHDPADSTTVRESTITGLAEDEQGHLWVGTATGVDLFDRSTERFIHLGLHHGRAVEAHVHTAVQWGRVAPLHHHLVQYRELLQGGTHARWHAMGEHEPHRVPHQTRT